MCNSDDVMLYIKGSNGEEPSYMFALARPGDQLAPAVRKTCGLPDLPELAPTAVILDMRDDRAYYLGEVRNPSFVLFCFLKNYTVFSFF